MIIEVPCVNRKARLKKGTILVFNKIIRCHAPSNRFEPGDEVVYLGKINGKLMVDFHTGHNKLMNFPSGVVGSAFAVNPEDVYVKDSTAEAGLTSSVIISTNL